MPQPASQSPPLTGAASTRNIARAVLIVVLAALSLYLIYLLRKPLGWIFIAGFLAIALAGPVNFLSRRMRRGLAIVVVYLLLLLTPVALAGLILPPMISQAEELVTNAPEYAGDVRDFVNDNATLRRLERDYHIVEKVQERAQELPGKIGDAAAVLGDLGLGLVNSIFAVVTILILSVFLVSSGPRWVRALLELQPPARAARLERTIYDISSAVGNYVAGALVQATIAGVLTFLVLTVLGMPFAAPLAVVVALFDLIPLVGATIAAVAVGIVTLFNDFPTTTIVWIIWSVVYQQLENNLIQPQIQRRAVDVHPFAVLTAVLFGSTLFGVPGALMAIPIAASIQIAAKEWWQWRYEMRTERVIAPSAPAAAAPATPPPATSPPQPPGPAAAS